MKIIVRMKLVSNKISLVDYSSMSGSHLDWISYQVNTNEVKLSDASYNLTASNDENHYCLATKVMSMYLNAG